MATKDNQFLGMDRRTKDFVVGGAKVIGGALMLAGGVVLFRKGTKLSKDTQTSSSRYHDAGEHDTANVLKQSGTETSSSMFGAGTSSGIFGVGLLANGVAQFAKAARNSYEPDESETVKTDIKPPKANPPEEEVVNPS